MQIRVFKDGIDILNEYGTCIRVTFVDEDGEHEAERVPDGWKKEDLIDATLAYLTDWYLKI